jgi:hypothetical protein
MKFMLLILLLALSACSTPTIIFTPSPAQVASLTSGRLVGSVVREETVPQKCGEMSDYGARFTWMTMNWAQAEPRHGQFNWQKLDPYIEAAHACGLDIGVHVMSNAPWAVLPVPPDAKGQSPSTPPKELNEYYDFVFNLARHYQGRISRYSIENEAHAYGAYYAGSPEQYLQMLQVARRAIHAADPTALVEDAGMSSSGIAIWLLSDMLKRGELTQATDLYKGYFPNSPAAHGLRSMPSTPEQAAKLLNDPGIQRVIEWGNLLFSHPEAYDVLQLHYYAPPEYLPIALAWVRGQLQVHGTAKPIEMWEMGYRAPSAATYDPQAHAENDAKLLTIALEEGASRAVIFQFTDYAAPYSGDMGLVTASGPRPAAQAFRVVAEQLNGTTDSARLDLGPGIWGYRFTREGRETFIVWSTTPTTVQIPGKAVQVLVTDISGNSTRANSRAVAVGVSPIFVTAAP